MTAPDTFDFDSSDEETHDTPLLSTAIPNARSSPRGRRSSSAFLHQPHSTKTITAIVISVVFVLEFGGFLMAIPAIRLYEDIICHHYYNGIEGEGHIGFGETIDEGMCKGEEVQEKLNILLAGIGVLGSIASLLTTIPYGLLADRVGRKPVFLLAMTGILLQALWELMCMKFWRTIPYHWVWIGPLFTFMGGGEAVATMSYYAIAADVMEESQRATVFLMGMSAALLGGMLAPSLASLLMARSLWLPLLLGFGILALGTFSFALIIPETLHLRRRATGSPILTADLASDRSISRNGKKHVKPSFFTAIKSKASESLKKLHGATSVLHSLPILLLLASFVVAPFSKHALGLSIRYISNRFHWTLRKTAFLLSLRAGINIVLLLVILPSISYLLISKLHYTTKTKDLFLARSSIIFLTIGSLLIASSPTTSLTILGLSVWTLGTGFSSLTRSLITTLVGQQHVGRLYAAIAVVETVGGLIAGPTLAALYALGLKWKGGWVGLPYFLLAGISLIGALGVWSFGCVGRREKRGDPEGEGEYRNDVDGDQILLGPDPADGDMIIDF